MRKTDKNAFSYEKIEKIIKYSFKNKELLKIAFSHSSYANENKVKSNERLEFLGDTILNFIITERIFHQTKIDEGELTRLRSRIVSEDPLAIISSDLGIDNFLLRGIGESKSPVSKAVKADLVESVIGAMYEDSRSLDVIREFISFAFAGAMQIIDENCDYKDAKTLLQEKCVTKSLIYNTIKLGEDHAPIYTSKVKINGKILGKGTSTSKRSAEQIAAEEALKNINL
ncbi:MAG: ribonuclease III [Clostridia bacterium]